jgi:hypothetical protein
VHVFVLKSNIAQKQNAMKAIISLFTLLLISLSLSAVAGHIIPATEEPYVDDIPFNTSLIAINLIIPPAIDTAADDIPFNTAAIAMIYKPCPIPMEAEAEVDDIPFNTAEVCARLKQGSNEGASASTHEPDELELFIETLSLEIDSLLKQALGDNFTGIIDESADLLEEMGRLIIEELNFLSSYLNSLKSF